jgi:hypothetical protein
MSTSKPDLKNYKSQVKKRTEVIESDEEEEGAVATVVSPSPAKAKKKKAKNDDESIDDLLEIMKANSAERQAQAAKKEQEDREYRANMINLLTKIADKS